MSNALFKAIVGVGILPSTVQSNEDVPVVYRTLPVSPIMNGVTPSAPSEAPQPITENPVNPIS